MGGGCFLQFIHSWSRFSSHQQYFCANELNTVFLAGHGWDAHLFVHSLRTFLRWLIRVTSSRNIYIPLVRELGLWSCYYYSNTAEIEHG